MGVGLAFLLGEREVVDVILLGQSGGAELDDLGAVGQVGLGQLPGRLFQDQPVEVHDVDARQQLGHTGAGLEGVGIGALRDDAGDVHPVAADVGHDAGDRGDGGGDAQRGVVVARRRPPDLAPTASHQGKGQGEDRPPLDPHGDDATTYSS